MFRHQYSNGSSSDSDPRHTCNSWRRCRSPRERSRERRRPPNDALGLESDDSIDSHCPVMSGALPASDVTTSSSVTDPDADAIRRTSTVHGDVGPSSAPGDSYDKHCRCRRCSQRAESGDKRSSDSSVVRSPKKKIQPLKSILKKTSQEGRSRLKKRVSFSSDQECNDRQGERPRHNTSVKTAATRASAVAHWLRNGPQPDYRKEKDGYESDSESGEETVRTKSDLREVEGRSSIDDSRVQDRPSPREGAQPRDYCTRWCCGSGDDRPQAGPSTVRSVRTESRSDTGRVQHDLLHTHQTWCRGRCFDTVRFVRHLGACSNCAESSTEPIHPSARCGLMPVCRTWIHCCSKRIARDLVFGSDRRSSSEKALRIGFSEAYICELRGYIGIEAYLAFLRHDLHEATLFEWLFEPDFKEALDQAARFGWQRLDDMRKLSCEQLGFLHLVATEAGRTGELWTSIQVEMAGCGEGMIQRSVGRLVDGWIFGWTRRPRHRSRPRLH